MILALFIGFFMVGLILFVIGFKYWNPNKSRASKFLFEHDFIFQNLCAIMTFINDGRKYIDKLVYVGEE